MRLLKRKGEMRGNKDRRGKEGGGVGEGRGRERGRGEGQEIKREEGREEIERRLRG